MNNSTYIHKYLKGLISDEDTVVDMTCGGGNDTFFLCERAKKVYGFDIQKEAIEETRERCKDFANLTLINDSHTNIDKYDITEPKLFIFNLGYYPHGDHSIISNAKDTLVAFIKAYALLKEGGYLAITFYMGHIGGKDEYYLIDKYISDNKLNILDKYRQYRSIDEPVTYIIKK